jgi:hypothetical protein
VAREGWRIAAEYWIKRQVQAEADRSEVKEQAEVGKVMGKVMAEEIEHNDRRSSATSLGTSEAWHENIRRFDFSEEFQANLNSLGRAK